MLEVILRYLIGKYGAEVIDWTLRQVVERWTAEGGDPNAASCASDACAYVLHEMKKGVNLDPDCGVYFWELPTKEQ